MHRVHFDGGRQGLMRQGARGQLVCLSLLLALGRNAALRVESQRAPAKNASLAVSLRWLAEAQRQPLLTLDRSVAGPLVDHLPNATTCRGGVFFVHYHKTGAIWTMAAERKFRNVLGYSEEQRSDYTLEHYPEGGLVRSFVPAFVRSRGPLLRPNANTVTRIANPGPNITFPADACIVHWVRSPIDMLLSSYRYHASRDMAEEWEERRPGVCHGCYRSDLELFSTCDFHCSYLELLQALDEQKGLVVDAAMERRRLDVLLRNVARWGSSAQVLQLSMEHLMADYSGTVACLLRFLQLDANQELSFQLQLLDWTRPNNKQEHSTRRKHDNTALRKFLRLHKAWGPQLREARELIGAIYRREALQYGCPVPAHE